ncbi:MAG: type II toxin-antitoxin system RelE/ParE family toxin [Tepidisphaeraceae bacterium]
MRYRLDIRPSAKRDFDRLSPDVAKRIVRKLESLRNNLGGDVKRLVSYSIGYRLRVGDWRVLFDVQGPLIIVRAVRHRSEAY